MADTLRLGCGSWQESRAEPLRASLTWAINPGTQGAHPIGLGLFSIASEDGVGVLCINHEPAQVKIGEGREGKTSSALDPSPPPNLSQLPAAHQVLTLAITPFYG